MKNLIVAVSGGVDSVVLLDMLARSQEYRLIVAHVEHGIRGEDSKADARFVAGLAKKYQLPFVMTELRLGKNASEEAARKGRYDFLFQQAEKFNANIATAHHADDVSETVAINIQRGTGWRGLTVLNRARVERPLLSFTKSQLYEYALQNGLEWVQDETNSSDDYLRNRLRKRLNDVGVRDLTRCILELRARQIVLRRDIELEVGRLLQKNSGSRYFLTQIDNIAATELLAEDIKKQTGVRPTQPQLERALLALKTTRAGAKIDVGGGVLLEISSRTYRAKVV